MKPYNLSCNFIGSLFEAKHARRKKNLRFWKCLKICFKKKRTIKLFPLGLEPRTLCVLGTRDNHYTTETYTKSSPSGGLEPTTLRLKVWCSTNWANRATLFRQRSRRHTFAFNRYSDQEKKPLERFELETPGLQDQCSNHWAIKALLMR